MGSGNAASRDWLRVLLSDSFLGCAESKQTLFDGTAIMDVWAVSGLSAGWLALVVVCWGFWCVVLCWLERFVF